MTILYQSAGTIFDSFPIDLTRQPALADSYLQVFVVRFGVLGALRVTYPPVTIPRPFTVVRKQVLTYELIVDLADSEREALRLKRFNHMISVADRFKRGLAER